MKKFLSAIMAMMLTVSLFAMPAMAADKITVTLDGEEIVFDVEPQIINERTMVPVRAIFEALGATVDWNQEKQIVTAVKGQDVVEMQINNTVMWKNLTEIFLDTPPMIIDERTLVPARAVAEAFDLDVDWDGATQTVIITTLPDNESADVITEYTQAYETLGNAIKERGEFDPEYDAYYFFQNEYFMYKYGLDGSISASYFDAEEGADRHISIYLYENLEDTNVYLGIELTSGEKWEKRVEYIDGEWYVVEDTFGELSDDATNLMFEAVSVFDENFGIMSGVTLYDLGITY